MTEQTHDSRRRVFAVAVSVCVAVLTLSVWLVASRVRDGVADIQVQTMVEREDGVVVFTNRGSRTGFQCGWVNIRCTNGATKAANLCSDEVAPGAIRQKRVPLPGWPCAVAFSVEDTSIF